MACFGDDPDDEQENKKLVRSADFDGPTRHRHCTDCFCFILMLIMWAAMTAIGIYAVTEGDYRLVLYPMDYDGNVCGTDFGGVDMTDYPYLLYVNSFSGGVCVSDCPSVRDALSTTIPVESEPTSDSTEGNVTSVVQPGPPVDLRTLVTYGGIWQTDGAELELDFTNVANYNFTNDALYCDQETCFPDPDDVTSSWTSRGVRRGFGYAYYAGDTYEVLWRCYYTAEAENEILQAVSDGSGGLNIIDDATAIWNKLMGDLWIARKYVFGLGFGVSLIVSLVYIFLMRLPLLLDLMVWVSIFVTIGLFFVGGYYSWEMASQWDDAVPQTVDDNTINATRIASVLLHCLGGLLLILTVRMQDFLGIAFLQVRSRHFDNRITHFVCKSQLSRSVFARQFKTAIGCVKEAGRAVNHMFLILLVPMLQSASLFIFFLVFMYYAVHLASLGEITSIEIPVDEQGETEIAIRKFEMNDFVGRCAWFYLFCLFWTANFIGAAGDMMIAVSVGHYYFARNKMSIGSWTVLRAIWQVCFYHLGTCAYGSLVIASIQFIRAVIARAQRAAKRARSKIAQALLCCCQCCFCCLEKCLKFMNKNAYIQTALFSTPFCKSTRRAFYLIVRNAARVASLTYVSAAILIVGKLFISAVTTVISYYALLEDLEDDLHSVAGPLAFIFLISYWLSDFFMGVFDMAISTTLHCLIADEEMNNGRGEYEEESLKRFVDANAQERDEYEG